MKKILTLPVLSLFLLSFLLTDEKPTLYSIDSVNKMTKIIAFGNYRDENNEDLSFCVENPDDIKRIINELKLGDHAPNAIEDETVGINVIQDYEEVSSWLLSPQLQYILTNNGQSYKIDLEKIKALHKKYPLKYILKEVSFKSKIEFEEYRNTQKQNSSFLYATIPLFRYEGSFEIQFPKNSKFTSPLAIDNYIRPMVSKIEPDQEKFSISYILDSYNFNNEKQYTITIQGSKKIFDNLKVDDLENKNWKLTDETAFFYYKEK